MPVTHWMAHYIAELMIKADTTQGEEREAAQKKCFEAILMLWKHRSDFPKGVRPFEKFECIIETLERLSPENRESWIARFRSSPESCDTETKKLLHIMENFDRSARSILSTLLDVAVMSCQDNESQAYLQTAQDDLKGQDMEIVERLYEKLEVTFGDDEKKESKRKVLKERLDNLDRFLSSANMVRELLASKIQGKRGQATPL